jgi:hypothetical protein
MVHSDTVAFLEESTYKYCLSFKYSQIDKFDYM